MTLKLGSHLERLAVVCSGLFASHFSLILQDVNY